MEWAELYTHSLQSAKELKEKEGKKPIIFEHDKKKKMHGLNKSNTAEQNIKIDSLLKVNNTHG